MNSGSESGAGSDSESESTNSGSRVGQDRKKKGPALNVNERRTRRGVYAIVQEQDDESDESDDDESNMPLAGAKDVPTDGEIELEAGTEVSSGLTSLSSTRSSSNPCVSSSIAPLSSISSLSSLSSSGAKQAISKSAPSTPFRSIISTRRQKAQTAGDTISEKIAQQSVTPPPAGATASPAESPKRLTRSSASLTLSATSVKLYKKRNGSSASTPAATPSKREKVKKEELETRVLRTRLSSLPNPPDVPKTVLAKPEIPKGPDGKPLPICGTCSSILPVISVDSKVVWGLGIEMIPRKGKKRKQQECPRSVSSIRWPVLVT
jgi:[histone H4]-N-methyl-L-lysine20 N-methyltransferase